MSSKDLTLIFNCLCLLIFVFNIYLGYKNGFFKTVIKMVSGIVAFFLALNFAPVFAKAINLASFLPQEYLLFEPFINRIIWYFITFIVAIIVLKIVALLTELINKAPIIGTFNKLMGLVVSFIYSFAICAIISIVLSLPIFSIKEAYTNSFFKPINTITIYCLNNVSNLDLEFDSYTDAYKTKLYEWLINNELINTELKDIENYFELNDKEGTNE